MWQFLLVAAVAGFVSDRLRAAVGRVEELGRRGLGREVSGSDLLEEEGGFGFSSSGSRFGVEQRKGARRVCVCLRRRRVGRKVVADGCGLCPLKGSCSFGWGLGVGIMYTMAAGKSEISKLNSAVEEAAKNVGELRAELNKRNSSTKCDGEHTNLLDTENNEHDDIKISGFPLGDDGEYPSSVLTEDQGQDQDRELLEIDQLEVELMLELQKLPGCSTGASSQPDDTRQNLHEFNLVNDTENEMKNLNSDPYQFRGVDPSELEQKLSFLLIEQQENQIMELESELQRVQLRLDVKESELRALKDCIRRLTEPSILTVTDVESEAHEGGSVGCPGNWDYNNMVGSESNQSLVVMKRPNIDSALCSY